MKTNSYTVVPLSFSGMESHPVLNKIRSLFKLNDGWHFGEGKKPSTNALAVACILVTKGKMLGIQKSDVFPEKNGDVTVAFYIDEEDHSFRISDDLKISYWIETDPDFDEIKGFSIEGVFSKLREILSLWSCYPTFTSDSGTKRKNIFAVPPSPTQATARVYRLLKKPVRYARANASAVMPAYTIRQSAPYLPFLFRSTAGHSHLEPA